MHHAPHTPTVQSPRRTLVQGLTGLFTGTLLGALLAIGTPAAAAGWPAGPVRIVVPYPPGGLTDVVTRVVAEGLGKQIGQTVIVENKPGAGGQIGLQGVLQAPRDGQTIALVVPATMITLPLTNPAYKIQPLKDFEPLTSAVDTAMTLIVSPQLGVKTLKDFVAYAKANPGKLNYGTPGAGTSYHFSNLLMAKALGFTAAHIPYQGEVKFLADVAGGTLQYSLVSSAAKATIEAGKVIPLAVTSGSRNPTLPNVPTFVEQGVDFKTDGWVGYALAAGTPPEVVNQVAAALVKAIRSPEVSQRLTSMGFVVAGNERAAFKDAIVRSTAVYKELVDSGAAK
jgi:tripartite-type tricarboxylate transporter receptor subunit TctC